MSFAVPACLRYWPVLATLSLLLVSPLSHAQRVSARDRTAVEALEQRMAAAEKRYRDGLVLVANSDPRGAGESDAALEDMEDVLDACIKQRGCQVHTLLASYKRLLKDNTDGQSAGAEDEGEAIDALDDGTDHATPAGTAVPETARTATLLNDQRHAFDRMVEYNPAIQAGIRRWLTDMRPALIDSYENYQNMRAELYPAWERSGLPEALLFGIMAKESNGKVHSTSRAGAAGPMQFMFNTGARFGLGRDASGFDTRYDPYASGQASAAYINERMRGLNNNIELALAAYNGGEGRAARVYRENSGLGFWDDVVYSQFPGETRDYVPMVIAAAWLFLHPRQYGLEFPKVNAQPAPLKLARDASIYELTICLGNGGTREGYMRTLRNLNPRYQAETWLPAGTTLKANARIAGLYSRYCINGPRAELARTLVSADPAAAIRRAQLTGNVAVGDVTPVVGVPTTVATGEPKPAEPKAKQAREYRVAKGDTLGRISKRFQCDQKKLARANNLKAPAYAVRPGQELTLESCKK
ncbi:transglycosylase SLT domain-containing protein [Pseudoxanthomonas sp. Root630]|uniref:transglycosylase SLT domain-containing protein n=1 Tax=Pseudoxanthomonas sp. Root630 TaxID=1736574 RepID=UPI000703AA70|nr:transglycosylase SLT domain-containing protein [Pseudoxanthomonas sp. Root630]KRA42393.1 lytic transglycosylase [Pseudoxanthomonas sp. Root630]